MGGASSKQKKLDQKSLDVIEFFDIIKSDDIDKVKAFLPSVDVNATNSKGRTALYYVKSKELAEFLIDKGADVNAKDKFEYTPLHHARNGEVAEVLIDHGADLEAIACNFFKKQETPLASACTSRVDVAFSIINNLTLEQLNNKPDFLTQALPLSQHWDEVQKEKKERFSTQENVPASKTVSSVLREKIESDIVSTVQTQGVHVATEISDSSSLLGTSTLFTPTSTATDSEEEISNTAKRKTMLNLN